MTTNFLEESCELLWRNNFTRHDSAFTSITLLIYCMLCNHNFTRICETWWLCCTEQLQHKGTHDICPPFNDCSYKPLPNYPYIREAYIIPWVRNGQLFPQHSLRSSEANLPYEPQRSLLRRHGTYSFKIFHYFESKIVCLLLENYMSISLKELSLEYCLIRFNLCEILYMCDFNIRRILLIQWFDKPE